MRVSTDIAEHPKSLLLEAELGERNAWAYMVRIWGWLTEYQDDGHIPALLAAIVERRAGWGGEPGKLLAAAEKVGFLDVDLVRGGWLAHNWNERNGAAISKAKIDAKRKRAAYESAKAASIQAEEKTSAILAGEKRGDSAEKAARKPGEKSASRGYGTGRDRTRPDVTKDFKNPPTPLSGEAAPPPGGQEGLALAVQETKPPLERDVDAVMAHYLKAMRASGIRARDTPGGREFIRDRLTGRKKKDSRGWSVEDCLEAINGLTWSDHHMQGGFTGIKYALRSSEQVEMMLQRKRGAA